MRAFSSAWVAPALVQIASTSRAPSEPTTSPSARRSLPTFTTFLACFRVFDLAFLALIRVAMVNLSFGFEEPLTHGTPFLSQQGIWSTLLEPATNNSGGGSKDDAG